MIENLGISAFSLLQYSTTPILRVHIVARPGAWFVAMYQASNPGLGQGRDILGSIYCAYDRGLGQG
ncbi:MAG: hypothetical protein IMF18_01620 [Proteobacteria bacterium]|nr:hypothetical protein [Pseudomonadota bacterium]